MGENGRKAVLERYNWGEMEKRLLEVYRQVEEMGRGDRFRDRRKDSFSPA